MNEICLFAVKKKKTNLESILGVGILPICACMSEPDPKNSNRNPYQISKIIQMGIKLGEIRYPNPNR